MNKDLAMAFIRHQNMLDNIYAQTHRAIDNQHWWMNACIVGAILVVPAPFTIAGLVRATLRLRALKRHADQIAAAVPTS